MGITGRTLKGQHRSGAGEGNLGADLHQTAGCPPKVFQEEGDATPMPHLLPGHALTCLAAAAAPGETLPATLLAHEGCPRHPLPAATALRSLRASHTEPQLPSLWLLCPGLSEGKRSRSRRKHTFWVLFFLLRAQCSSTRCISTPQRLFILPKLCLQQLLPARTSTRSCPTKIHSGHRLPSPAVAELQHLPQPLRARRNAAQHAATARSASAGRWKVLQDPRPLPGAARSPSAAAEAPAGSDQAGASHVGQALHPREVAPGGHSQLRSRGCEGLQGRLPLIRQVEQAPC